MIFEWSTDYNAVRNAVVFGNQVRSDFRVYHSIQSRDGPFKKLYKTGKPQQRIFAGCSLIDKPLKSKNINKRHSSFFKFNHSYPISKSAEGVNKR